MSALNHLFILAMLFAGWTNCGSVKKAERVEKIVLLGGMTQPLNLLGWSAKMTYTERSSAVVIYDVASDTWARGKIDRQTKIYLGSHVGFSFKGNDLPKPTLLAATVGIDDTFLLIGGLGEGKIIHDTIYKYDNGDWLEMPQRLSLARFEATAVIVAKGEYPICPD